MPRTLLALAALTTLAITGCGKDDDNAATTATLTQEAIERHQTQLAEVREAAATCDDELSPLVDELAALNSRLDIGMSYDDYTDAVGDALVLYDRIDDDAFQGDPGRDCLTSVGDPAERALRAYRKAAETWQRCLDDFDCSLDDINPNLQRPWARAATAIDEADEALDSFADVAATTSPGETAATIIVGEMRRYDVRSRPGYAADRAVEEFEDLAPTERAIAAETLLDAVSARVARDEMIPNSDRMVLDALVEHFPDLETDR